MCVSPAGTTTMHSTTSRNWSPLDRTDQDPPVLHAPGRYEPSAIRSAVNVLPVPQAMMSRPRSRCSTPWRTLSIASFLQCPGLADRTFDLVGYEPVVVGGKVDPADVRPLNDVLRYSAPAPGGYDPPQAEGLVLRTRQEGLDIVLRHPMAGCIALALDGDPGSITVLRHQVDADIVAAQAGQSFAIRDGKKGCRAAVLLLGPGTAITADLPEKYSAPLLLCRRSHAR